MAGTSTTPARSDFDVEHKREKPYMIKVVDEHARA